MCRNSPKTALIMIQYIADRDHYVQVLQRCATVKHDLWIGTSDLKDLYVENHKGIRCSVEPFLAVLDRLLKQGVEIHLLHAKEPGDNFRADFDKYPSLWSNLQRRLCPRVHFKILIFDNCVAYIGSANLTGAGIGMKSDGNHNFEAGILTDDPTLVDLAANHFDSVFGGLHCRGCKRKGYCGDRIK